MSKNQNIPLIYSFQKSVNIKDKNIKDILFEKQEKIYTFANSKK
jgi:hypothetical protein